MTVVSTFAPSLGLSLYQQQIGFALGVILVLAGLVLFLHGRRSEKQEPSSRFAFGSGDLARAHTALGRSLRGDSESGRVYGGAEIGAVLRQRQAREEERAVYEAVEGEVSLAYEEALEMAKMLCTDDPQLKVDAAVVRIKLPDWRAKTTEFIGAVLGSAQRAAFKGAATGSNVLERLESEGAFLSDLALKLTPDSIRVSKEQALSAMAKRRDHELASLFNYNPATPHPAPLAEQLDSLMREGMELLDELMAPPQVEETGEGEWAMEFGDAPPEWNDKANAFYKTIKDLLAAEHPALIPDFESGFNERLRIQREREETRKVASQQPGKRSTAQTMIDFATDTQRTPAKVVEACLEGLSNARKAI